MPRALLTVLLIAFATLSCTKDALRPEKPMAPDGPTMEISDAANSEGNSHFFFLPPLRPQPNATGVFDSAIEPTVEVCEWSGSCGLVVARFTKTTGTGGATIVSSGQHYAVNWKTDECESGPCTLASSKTYRLRVLVVGSVVGFADLAIVANGSQLKNVQTAENIGLVDGRTLPVKFRIEVGMVVGVSVSPSAASVAAGQSLQFTATLSDAHGAVVTGPVVTWFSSNATLATVDASGVVTTLEPGAESITARADGMEGATGLTITKAPATLAFDPAALNQIYNGTPRVVGVTTSPAGLSGVSVTYNGSPTPPTGAGTYAVVATLNHSHFEASPVAASLAIDKAFAVLTIDATTLNQTQNGTPRIVVVTTTPAGLSGVTVTYDGSPVAPINSGTYAVSATLSNADFGATPVAGTLNVALVGVADEVSSGGGHSCARAIDGTIACWGGNGSVAIAHPGGVFTQVTAGQIHSCGLRADGTAVCWGYNGNSQAGSQSGPFVQISGGGVHSCGVRTSGLGFCWGGSGPAPAGTFSQISAGGNHTCGVLTSGAVACSGNNSHGQSAPPAGPYIQVSGGWLHTCGVQSNGSVACWGSNEFGQSTAPSGSFKQVSAAYRHSCGVKADDSVACWGWNPSGQASPPPGTFRQVSGANEFTCGVRTDRIVQCWGNGSGGATSVPAKFSAPAP